MTFASSSWRATLDCRYYGQKTSQEQKYDANHLYKLFSSYIRLARINGTVGVLFKTETRLIFPRLNGPIDYLKEVSTMRELSCGGRLRELISHSFLQLFRDF